MSKAGYERAAEPKEWFEIPGATHHSLYDDEAQVGGAVAKLEEFFGTQPISVVCQFNGRAPYKGYRDNSGVILEGMRKASRPADS